MSSREDFIVSKIDRSRESEQGRESRLRYRSILEETACSVVNALFGTRSPEEREQLAWLVIDEVVDRLVGWIGAERVISGLGAIIKRVGDRIFINPKASSAKTAAEAVFRKEPA